MSINFSGMSELNKIAKNGTANKNQAQPKQEKAPNSIFSGTANSNDIVTVEGDVPYQTIVSTKGYVDEETAKPAIKEGEDAVDGLKKQEIE